MMKEAVRLAYGDRVRHLTRPEWGTGSIVRAEDIIVDGEPRQRLSVRFPGVGVKTLNTAHARLERIDPSASAEEQPVPDDQSIDWKSLDGSEWLAPLAERKIREAMTSLPAEVRDPFRPARERLRATLDLFRFIRSERGLTDWAIAQSGLDDPLTRFGRHELEEFFERWARERDAHLARVLGEVDTGSSDIESLLARAPAPGRDAVRRLVAVR